MTLMATHEAGPRDATSSALLGRARAVFRRTGRDLKDALAIVAELEECANRCYVAAEDSITEEVTDSVAELLHAVRDEHPNQELEIIIFAAPTEVRGGEQNGHHPEGQGPFRRGEAS
jgi:hypothetical protein